MKSNKIAGLLLMAALLMGGLTGCVYQKPVFEQVGTSETAFVIPLEGNTDKQVAFDSEHYLESKKVGLKRIQIPTRWNKTGYGPTSGEFIPTTRVIKVDRSPVTRQWSVAAAGKAVSKTDPSGQNAIWIESSDGIGFSMGFNCTAYIAESDAAKFLYWYKGDQLQHVMDSEVKGRYQQAAAAMATRYKLDELREKKQEIVDAVKQDIIPFFAQRGITITTIGQFGGMTYEDPAIQEAINKTFIAQQKKVVSAAELAAQDDINNRIELEANATAEKHRREAQGRADAIKFEKAAEAEGIRMVNNAIKEANQNPQLVQLKSLEVARTQVEKWDGKFPVYFMGGGGTAPTLFMNVGGNVDATPTGVSLPTAPAKK